MNAESALPVAEKPTLPIQIHGETGASPILLFLRGSGMTMTPFTTVLHSWEEHLTVVQGGPARHRQGPGCNGAAHRNQPTFDLTASDGIEVA
jgi:hypothetical protein